MKAKVVLCFSLLAFLVSFKANAQCSPVVASPDDRSLVGNDSWIGHVYDGGFATYLGQYTRPELFDENFGSATGCFNITSAGNAVSVHAETFSVRYIMTSTKKGLYVVNLGNDDGGRLFVGGPLVYDNYTSHSYSVNSNVLISLNGNTKLLYDYHETTGANRVSFQGLTQVIGNTLSGNTTQIICMGNSGAAISGDVFGTLPSGIALGGVWGTGYSWSYSTTPGGSRTSLSGNGATFTPSTASAPFNTPGTYYVYRTASLISNNNISPNPYTANNESNAATIVVSGGAQWTGAVSTDWANAGNWCGGVPDASSDVSIKTGAARMPEITSTANCKNLTIEAGATLTGRSGSTLNVSGNITNNGSLVNLGTINFNGAAAQTFSGITNFFNLTKSNAGTLTLSGNITVAGSLLLSGGAINASNFGILIRGNWTNNASVNAFVPGTGIVYFGGNTAQTIGGSFSTRFNILEVTNTGNTVSLAVNTTILGNLSVSSGTLDLGAFTANRSASGGTITVLNNAFLKIGGTSTFPANYTSASLLANSYVEYSGTNQTVASKAYGNLVLSSSSGAAVKTVGAITIAGSLSMVKGPGTSVSSNVSGNVVIGRNVSIGVSTTLNAGSFTYRVGGNWINDGTFNRASSTVIFTGTGASITSTAIQPFYDLTIEASGISYTGPGIHLTGDLLSTGAGSLQMPVASAFTMAGSHKSITGNGFLFGELRILEVTDILSSIKIAGDFYIEQYCDGSSGGIINMSGANNTIFVGPDGVLDVSILNITGNITTQTNLYVFDALNVSGSFTATSGFVEFFEDATFSGTANLYNVLVTDGTLTLSSGSVLGIASELLSYNGNVDVTSSIPNTILYNGIDYYQNVNAMTYDILQLSNGGYKSFEGAITINNNLQIDPNVEVLAGSFAHTINGNWHNNGSYTPGGSSTTFAGSKNKHIYGYTNFGQLIINGSQPSTTVSLHNNITAQNVNMQSGKILTGADSIIITGNRTGSGIILGNITRFHSFTTGTAYAFEGPENTITFSSLSPSINKITVSVKPETIADFPDNNAITREYIVSVPAATYSATLRLHYEDAELNGNNESAMELWKNGGVSWAAAGKNGNSTSSNYVQQNAISNINGRWTLTSASNVVRWSGNISSNWQDAGNWTAVSGLPNTPPSANDIVEIGVQTFNNQPSVNTAVTVKNIILGSAKAVTLSMNTGGSLTTASILGKWTGNSAHTLNVNNETVNINGDFALSDGTGGHEININIGTGSLNVAGILTQSGNAAINFSGAGNLAVQNDYTYVSGNFTAGTGTVIYNGTVNQDIAGVNYHHLVVNKAAAEAHIEDSTNVAGNLTVVAGTLKQTAGTVVAGDINIATGSYFDNYALLKIGGNWNNNGSYTSGATESYVMFNGSGNQSIAATTFHDLEINKPIGAVAELTGDVILKGNLIGTSGTLDIKSYFFNRDNVGGTASIADAGTFIIGGNNAPNKFASFSVGTASTIIFNGVAAQQLTLPGIAYGNVIFRNSGTKNLNTAITVNGNLTIETGATLNAGTRTITLFGNWQNSGTFTAGSGDVLLSGTNKTMSGDNIFNKLIVAGRYDVLGNNTINTLLHITSSGYLSGAAGIQTTFNGDLINNGDLYMLGATTFTGNVVQTLSLINAVRTLAMTVNFNGTVSPVLNSTSVPQYGYLNINNTGGIRASVGYTILYALTVGPGASFHGGAATHSLSGPLTNSGTITSSGTFNFIGSSARTIDMGSGFSSTGTVVFGGAGAATLVGSPVALNHVLVSNSNISGITASGNWTLAGNLTINSNARFNAVNRQISIAGNIDNRGILNKGTSTFIMNGTAFQTIYSASAFHNLIIHNTAAPVSLLTNVTVDNTLDFVKGNITTNNFSLIQPATGMLTNASQTNGWVNGNLKKGIAAAATERVFETGDANYYTPVSLSLQSVTTGGSLTVSSIPGDHASLNTSPINSNKNINRYWKLLNEGIVLDSATAAFKYPFSNVDAGAATALFQGVVYNGSGWDTLATASANDTVTTIGTKTLTGDFTAGEICYKNTRIAFGNTHYCTTAGTVTPVITGAAGGTFSGGPGLIINATTGEITPSASTAGEYTVAYTLAANAECKEFTTTTIVNITQAPEATFSYAAGAHCTGGGIILPEITGTAGGVFSANPALAINASTGAIDLGASAHGIYDITYTIAASGGCASAQQTISFTITKPGKWTGTVSSAWFDPANWLCGILPDGNINVTIEPGAGYYPVIDTGVVQLNDLTVSNGASLEIKTVFKISGSIKNTGSIDASAATLEFTGTDPQTIKANTFVNNAVKNIIISNSSNDGLILSGALDIYGALTYTAAGNKFITNDFLTLKSNATGTARVGNMTGKTISGNVTVENYIPPRRAWYFLSIPTNTSQNVRQSWQEGALNAASNPVPGFGTQLTSNRASWQTDGFDASSVSPSIKKYDPVSNGWIGLANTNVSGIKATDGYMVYIRGDRSVVSGPATTSTVLRTKGPLYTGGLAPVTVQANKKAAVGNPYAAPLDLRKLSKTGVKDFFHVWDPMIGGTYGSGIYQVLSPDGNGNYVVVPGGGSYGPGGSVQNYIASGLAFLVEGDNNGGSINFDENAKYAPEEEESLPRLRSSMMVNLLSVNADNSTAVADGLLVNFDAQYSNSIDKQDAVKINNSTENLAVAVGSQSLIVERRNMKEGKDTLYMKLSNLRIQTYRLSINAASLNAGGRAAWLVDSYTNTHTALQLDGNTVVDFSVTSNTASSASNRFKIVFDQLVVVPVKFVSVKAHSAANNTVDIDWQTADETNTSHYEVERSVDGIVFNKILSTPAKGGNHALYSLNDGQPQGVINYYRIKGVENSGIAFYSNIVKVQLDDEERTLKVYPNPVTDGKVNLLLGNMPKGIYAVQLVNMNGQVVYSSQFKHESRNSSTVIDTGKKIAAGVYKLIATGPDGSQHMNQLIIK